MEPEQPASRPGVDQLRAVGRGLLRIPFPASVLPVLGWGALIWYLSSRSEVDPGPLVPGVPLLGNLAHAFEFGMLALWFVLVLPRRAGWPVLSGLTVAVTVGAGFGYALLDEWHQSRVPERNASLFDLLTDVVGIVSVVVVVGYVGRPGATSVGLWRRLAVGFGGCVTAAGLATFYQSRYGGGPWPFG